MNVVETLKKHSLSKIQFALDFYLSRPTLDDYINKFEQGKSLPKSKYQIIFDTLFGSELDLIQFKKEYEYFKTLMSRDRAIRLDDLSPEATDKIFRIIDGLKESALNDDSLELINFIYFVADGYNYGNELSKAWVLYFNELNGLKCRNDISDRLKKYLGCFYTLNRDFLVDDSRLDIANYDLFIKRKDELKRKRQQRKREIQEKVSEIIKQRVEEEMKKMSADTSDDEIVQKIVGDIQ